MTGLQSDAGNRAEIYGIKRFAVVTIPLSALWTHFSLKITANW